MIIPMVCFTCGKPLSHLWDDYIDYVKKYELEDKKTKATQTPEFKALSDLKIGRDCCRRMLLCQHDMYDKVK